jgi:DnaJ-class molecular chaperone
VEDCKYCDGTGLAKYPATCVDCEGTGKIEGTTCSLCNGTGKWLRETICLDCGGSGIKASADPRDQAV